MNVQWFNSYLPAWVNKRGTQVV